MATLRIKRGTRSQLNAAATASGLRAGEPYLITDESRFAVGLAAGTYQDFLKVGEVSSGVQTVWYDYVATASQTTFSATYTVGFVDVYLNGLKLVPTSDFTASNGTQVVLASGAAAGDSVCIVASGTFSVANVYTQAQTDSLLSAKQATLVSGTSIKTVNGTSLLGSGDITTPSGVTDHGALTGLGDDDHTQYLNNARGDARYSALGHGHAISDVTGLQTAIDGKQETLVSGTNIKTVNGTSIVGSGDVSITVSQSNLKSYFWAGA